MSNVDKTYKDLVLEIVNNGEIQPNRTGIDTLKIFCPDTRIKFDLREGFPILTTRGLPFKSTLIELEGFIKGITDKKWYMDLGCHFWDFWCNPEKVPYGLGEKTKDAMRRERDLGEIYGYQWRGFSNECGERGLDQLLEVVEKIIQRKDDRRLIVSAWNPLARDRMALVPCHFSFQFGITGDFLDLIWSQRSVDVACGLPQNIVSYAALLTLVAKTANLTPRFLVGDLRDTHIYLNHLDEIKKQVTRENFPAPNFVLDNFTDLWHFDSSQAKLENYQHGEKIKYEVAV